MNPESCLAENSNGAPAAPIFVVGSPRSGTSILTWCLGQHSNILPLEESNWMGDFATDIAVRYAQGCQHGERSHLGAMGVTRDEFFTRFGNAIHGMMIRYRQDLRNRGADTGDYPFDDPDAVFRLARAQDDPKLRWVDGTPEYSLHIGGLRKLFPHARFIHIVRDVSDVVASMLHFDRIGTVPLFATPAQAYEYWLRTTQACVLAEQALGPAVVYRLRYADLIAQPEATLRQLCEFLAEPYESACIEPLRSRINSSQVPRGFSLEARTLASQVIERAEQLNQLLQSPLPAFANSSLASEQFESAFEDRVCFAATLDSEFLAAQRIVEQLNRDLEERSAWGMRITTELAEKSAWSIRLDRQLRSTDAALLKTRWNLNISGIVILLEALAGLLVCASGSELGSRQFASLCWIGVSIASCTLYAWLRRDGLRRRARNFVGGMARLLE